MTPISQDAIQIEIELLKLNLGEVRVRVIKDSAICITFEQSREMPAKMFEKLKDLGTILAYDLDEDKDGLPGPNFVIPVYCYILTPAPAPF